MSQKMKAVLFAAVFVLSIAGSTVAYRLLRERVAAPPLLEEPDGEDEEEKMVAPDFTVSDLDGNEYRLSDFQGKPVVLNFWASWCPPCKGEMPEFQTVYEELGEEIAFLMVNFTTWRDETMEKGAAYVEEQGFSFPVYYDTTGEVGTAYGARGIPMTYFIDTEGFLIAGIEGQTDEKTLRRGIELIR